MYLNISARVRVSIARINLGRPIILNNTARSISNQPNSTYCNQGKTWLQNIHITVYLYQHLIENKSFYLVWRTISLVRTIYSSLNGGRCLQ